MTIMDKIRILMADDEERMRKLVGDFLGKEGYETVMCSNGHEAVERINEDPSVSLVIMDVMMPVMDGWEAVRKIRETSNVPIIMLTAKTEEKDELKSFSLGVDEFIPKPFSPKVLVARVQALLRRTSAVKESGDIITSGCIKVDRSAHQVFVNDEAVNLSIKEFELLTYFLENKGIALSREKILNSVWDYDYFGEARTIDTHVKKLRAKLGPEAGDMIKTIWGMGYKFEE